jgi:hypothetical protein
MRKPLNNNIEIKQKTTAPDEYSDCFGHQVSHGQYKLFDLSTAKRHGGVNPWQLRGHVQKAQSFREKKYTVLNASPYG